MQTEDLKEKTADLANHIEDLAETFYRLTVVNIAQKASRIAAGTILSVCIGVLCVFVVLFLGFAFAWWMGDIVNSRPGGFLLGAALFLLLMFVIFSMGKKIIFPFVRNLIIRKIYDDKN